MSRSIIKEVEKLGFEYIDVIEKNEDGKYVLPNGKCNVSLGFLEGILNTRDGRALGDLYENHVKAHGLINLEESTIDGVAYKRWL
jgi:hypothetical protein